MLFITIQLNDQIFDFFNLKINKKPDNNSVLVACGAHGILIHGNGHDGTTFFAYVSFEWHGLRENGHKVTMKPRR